MVLNGTWRWASAFRHNNFLVGTSICSDQVARSQVRDGLEHGWQHRHHANSWNLFCSGSIYAGAAMTLREPMISEIEIIHLLDNDEAEFPDAAMLAASLVRRGWVSSMPLKYQALVSDFVGNGIIKPETTEIRSDMKPKIRIIIEDGRPVLAESAGAPIEIHVVDITNRSEVIYSTHEGESEPIPLMWIDPELDEKENNSDAS